MSLDHQNSVKIYFFGAHVTSWVCGGEEQLFMSKSAVFNGEKAIRGGIPLVFPQFGRPSEALAQHGFARNSIWKKLGDCQSESSGGVSVTFVLSDNERTRSLFPYSFKVYYKVHLKTDGLCLTFTVENPPEAESAFQCHTLIHTYLAINTESTVVKGFGGLSFKDHLDGLVPYPICSYQTFADH